MRVSVDTEDPGWKLYEQLRKSGSVISIFLDGVEQKSALTADEEEGYVIKTRLDDEGQIVIDWETGDIAFDTLRGNVVIQLEEGGR